MLVAAGVTAGAQYMNSEGARRKNQQMIDDNRARLDGVPLPELNESDYYGDVSRSLDPSMLNYGQYEYGGDYNTTGAAYDREVDPRLIEQSENAKFGRDAQVEALKKFQANIKSGNDPEFQARMDQAAQNSQGQAQSRMGSILQDAQRRGQMGSNSMLAAQMQGSSSAMSQGAQQSQMAAVESYKNQLQQQRDVSSMGRNLASDENSVASQNAQILNSFNERSSRAHQQYLTQQAEMQNKAKLRNLNVQQDMADANVAMKNRQTTDRYNAAQKERAYQNSLVSQRQGVRQGNFNNQLGRATGQMAQNNAQMGMNTQNAQDRNQMIQGVGNGFAGYYQGQQQADDRDSDRKYRSEERAKDRAAQYGS